MEGCLLVLKSVTLYPPVIPFSGLGPSYGKKVTWIGANGDQTFIKIDESLITAQMLPKMHVVANKKTIRE